MATVASLDKSQLDNTILFVESDNKYVADNGVAKAEFYPLGNKANFLSKGFSVAWTPNSMKYVDEFGMDDTIYSVQDAPLEVKANKARFDRSFPDVDDMFIFDGDRLKHTIIVQGWQRDPLPWLSGKIGFVISGRLEFDPSLSVHSMGMNLIGPFETSESIEIRNGEEVIFTLPKIVAYDSDIPQRAEAFGKYRVTANENGTLSFDIVMDNAWMADPERVYPILIDPTVVVSSAYDTSGNGGRKVTTLSNSWIVAVVSDNANGYAYLYVSKDKGQTWSRLCYVNAVSLGAATLTSFGTTIYLSCLYSSTSVFFWEIDALTQTDVNMWASRVTVDSSNSGFYASGISLAVNSTGTEIHLAYNAKTSTYPNSFNNRYAKGTISGNNVTWGSVTQITTTNTSGQNLQNSSIVVKSDGNPVIVSDFNGNGSYIYAWVYNGSTWPGKIVHNNTGYVQISPSVIVKKNGANVGRIFSGWHGLDSTDTAKQNIRVAYSDDGGNTWTTIGKITTGNTVDRKNVVFAENDTGDIYAFYEDNGNVVYQKCANGTTTFSGLTTIGIGTNPSVMERELNDLIGFIWKDATSVKFDAVLFNVAPTAPTNLSPNGTSIDRAQIQRLSWQYNDPNAGDGQSKFDLQWRPVGSGTWNTVTQTSPNQYWNAPANIFPHGNIEWKVRTYDQANVVGPYSAQVVFAAGDKPIAPTIIEPTETITIPRPNVSWSSADQVSYQVQVLNDLSAVVWDTNEVISGNKVVTVGIDLANNKTYTFKVRIKNADSLWSDYATSTQPVSYTPPATPTIAVTSQTEKILLQVTNPVPSGTQPNVAYNDLYRKKSNETAWVRIDTNISTNGSFTDYTAASGVSYDYKVIAIGDNGTIVESAPQSGTTTFTGIWLHDVADPAGTVHNFKYDGRGRNTDWKAEAEFMQFAGRKKPVVEFGEGEDGRFTAQLQMLTGDLDYQKLDALVKRKGTVCWRDDRGRKAFGAIVALPVADAMIGYSTTVALVEIDYKEEV